MSINNLNRKSIDPAQQALAVAASAAAAEEVDLITKNKKKLRVRKSKIRDVVRGLAEIAYSMGDTNDVDAYADSLTDTIFEAFKTVQGKQ